MMSLDNLVWMARNNRRQMLKFGKRAYHAFADSYGVEELHYFLDFAEDSFTHGRAMEALLRISFLLNEFELPTTGIQREFNMYYEEEFPNRNIP